MSGSGPVIERTARQLYRDCLRLIRHVAPGMSAKNTALTATVRGEFRKNRALVDQGDIDQCKSHAIRALSNYLLATSAQNDPKVNDAMQDYNERSRPKSSR
jgi:Complex 1 protein (LYR family)